MSTERRKSVPSYRRHKQSGQAVVTLTDAMGRRRDVLLGRHGTRASRNEYARVISEWEAGGRNLPAGKTATDITVGAIIRRFWAHVETHYRRADGTQTSEVSEFKYSLRPLAYLHTDTLASDFGPLKLKAVRSLMVRGYDHPQYGPQPALSRGVTNHRVERIKRMFRWATENELVPPSIYHGLQAIQGLQRGRTEARETAPVRPVPEAMVDAVRPFVSRTVEAIIDLQLLTGARPGELLVMRAIDIDTTGRIWAYRPSTHKTEHHGHQREIYLGPKAQEIVKPFLKTNVEAYLFSPKEAEAERLQIMRENRQNKVQPSQVCRAKKNPKRKAGALYDIHAYRRAVTRACEKAFPLPEHLARGPEESKKTWWARLSPAERSAVKAWRREHHWHPHQLRHSAATRLRKEYGLELARIILGHRSVVVTQIYAEVDKAKALAVVSEVG